MAVGLDEERERPPNHLRCRIAIEPLRPGIPGDDGPVEGLADDGVIRGLHEGGEPLEARLRLLALGDVAEPDAEDGLALHRELRDRCLSRKLGPVLADANDGAALIHGAQGIARRGEPGHVRAMALREPRGEQEVERAAYHFGCPVSEDGLRTLVEQADAVMDIDGDNGVLREFHDVREVGLKEWEIRFRVGPGRVAVGPLGGVADASSERSEGAR